MYFQDVWFRKGLKFNFNPGISMTGLPIAASSTKDSHSKQPYKVFWPVRNALLAFFFLILKIMCDLFFETKRLI